MRKSGDKNKAPDKSIFQEEKENKELGKNTVDTVTPSRTLQGWVWVINGKTNKQVSPRNIENHLTNGWRKI